MVENQNGVVPINSDVDGLQSFYGAILSMSNRNATASRYVRVIASRPSDKHVKSVIEAIEAIAAQRQSLIRPRVIFTDLIKSDALSFVTSLVALVGRQEAFEAVRYARIGYREAMAARILVGDHEVWLADDVAAAQNSDMQLMRVSSGSEYTHLAKSSFQLLWRMADPLPTRLLRMAASRAGFDIPSETIFQRFLGLRQDIGLTTRSYFYRQTANSN